MAKQYENDRDWLEAHLRTLMDIGRSLQNLDSDLPSREPTYDKGYWTGLKLICLEYYVPVYLNILGRTRNVAYIDLFSGPGLNLIGDAQVPMPGSPMIPIQHPRVPQGFDLYLLGDTNRSYVNALNRRIRLFSESNETRISNERVETRCVDANDFVHEIPGILKEHSIEHSLIFIDPEGLELKWESVKYLAENVRYSDWIVLFPSAGMRRLFGRTDNAAWERIYEFMGPKGDSLNSDSSETDAISIYRSNLADLGKEISTEIAITGPGSFHYHLIAAARRTKGNSPWFSSLEEVKRRVEALSGDVLEIVIQQIEGRMTKL